jgi:hypothetical protein
MKHTKMVAGSILLASAALLSASGCEQIQDAQGAVCCTEFQVGGTITADIGGSAQSQVAAQAVADFAGIASAAIDDITAACRSIAQDLDAPKASQDDAEATADKRARMKAWCDLAVAQIASFKATASGTLSVQFTPPVCEASISAKANCQAKCSGSASCDLKANPPTCEGGKLEVSCAGGCTASAGATVSCEGNCTAECQGECTAEGGVECAGRCDGTCEASGTGTGTGIQADGTCQGVCKGTCEVTAPSATCSGSCKGQCTGSCQATAGASVKCDGACDADYEPLKCSGGELKGGCQAEASCEGSCDASVKAKAECRPPEIKVVITGAANVDAAGKLKATFESNLGVILAFQARLEAMAGIAASFSANIGAVADVKAACIPAMIVAAGEAAKDLQVSVTATASIATSAK